MMLAELLLHGEQNAISTPDLCRILGLDDARSLRLLVARERAAGEVILSSCHGGYFLPDNRKEVERFVKTEHKKAVSTLAALKSARRYLKETEAETAGQCAMNL